MTKISVGAVIVNTEHRTVNMLLPVRFFREGEGCDSSFASTFFYYDKTEIEDSSWSLVDTLGCRYVHTSTSFRVIVIYQASTIETRRELCSEDDDADVLDDAREVHVIIRNNP